MRTKEGSYRRKTESLSEDYTLTAARQYRKQAIPRSDARLNMGQLFGFMGFYLRPSWRRIKSQRESLISLCRGTGAFFPFVGFA